MVANLNDVVVIAVHTGKIRFRAPDKRGAAAIIGVGRRAVLVVSCIRATKNHKRQTATIVSVGRSVVLDIVGVRTSENHKRQTAVIISVGRRVVLDIGGVCTTGNHKRQATAIVRVGRSVVLDVGGVRAAEDHCRGAAAIIGVGRRIVLGIGRIRATEDLGERGAIAELDLKGTVGLEDDRIDSEAEIVVVQLLDVEHLAIRLGVHQGCRNEQKEERTKACHAVDPLGVGEKGLHPHGVFINR